MGHEKSRTGIGKARGNAPSGAGRGGQAGLSLPTGPARRDEGLKASINFRAWGLAAWKLEIPCPAFCVAVSQSVSIEVLVILILSGSSVPVAACAGFWCYGNTSRWRCGGACSLASPAGLVLWVAAFPL